MFAGSYHFSRPDIIASTLNSSGIANTGTDEANHFIQMAGPCMRPGYLLPVHDLEAGDGIRTDSEMAQFALDFSNRIYEVMGIRPAIYINGNYAAVSSWRGAHQSATAATRNRGRRIRRCGAPAGRTRPNPNSIRRAERPIRRIRIATSTARGTTTA